MGVKWARGFIFGLGVLLASCTQIQPDLEEQRLGTASMEQAAIVISQVYSGGGNSGSYWQSDFIELFNRSSEAVDLTGWSIQYASANDSYWQATSLGGVLEPGQYYLVQQPGGTGGSAALPAPDAVGTHHMATASGKVALVSTTSPLAGVNPVGSAALVDLVAYGSANGYEGMGPAPSLTNTMAAFRKDDGCTDTNDNAGDFLRVAPQPRNSQSPRHLCYLNLPSQEENESGAPAPATPSLQAPVRLAVWDFEGGTFQPVSGSGTAQKGAGLGGESFTAGNNSSSAWSFSHWGMDSTLSADKYAEFTISTLGYTGLGFHFEERRSGTGPSLFTLAYSTDGSTFMSVGAAREVPNNTNWRGQSFNLSEISELDNRERVTLRVYGYGASGTTGTWRFDNVVFTASSRTATEALEETEGVEGAIKETELVEEAATEIAGLADVCGAPYTPIYSLSGTGMVVTEGVVTANFLSGLEGVFIQAPLGDGDPSTPDGIFVSMDAEGALTAPDVGEYVRVRAELGEVESVRQLYGVTSLISCGSAELGQVPADAPADPPVVEEVLEEAPAPAFVAQEATTDLINNLIDEVLALREQNVLNRGQGVSLVAKLQNAIGHLDKHENAQVKGLLQAFINEAGALTRGRTLTDSQAQRLIGAASAIMGRLE